MSPTLQDLKDAASGLPVRERAELAQFLLRSLNEREQFGDFEVGELDKLLAEGERSIEQEGTLDGDEAFRLRGQRRAQQRKALP